MTMVMAKGWPMIDTHRATAFIPSVAYTNREIAGLSRHEATVAVRLSE
jgi:hypothetical protein